MKKIIFAVLICLIIFACKSGSSNIQSPTRYATPQGTTATAQGTR